nr:peptide-methionine (R)-S-oxide reductase MsrB [Calycomorphotria hydatis]
MNLQALFPLMGLPLMALPLLWGCGVTNEPSISLAPVADAVATNETQEVTQVREYFAMNEHPPLHDRVEKSDAEWKEVLTDEQFRVARKHGTERAFTGEFWDEKTEGTYRCICCGNPLFSSETKYESGTGWPSFTDVIEEGRVGHKEDNTFFMRRTEVHCKRCEAHLGHVFPDGPHPTGMRYCINSVSLTLHPENDSEESTTSIEPEEATSEE